MKTSVDLPERQVKAIDELSRRLNVSPDRIVEQAVDEYLDQAAGAGDDSAFGLWKDRDEDGLVYQDRLRNEWPERR